MKKKLNFNAIFFYLTIGSISFILFYLLSSVWTLVYRIFFSLTVTLFFILGMIVFNQINFFKFDQIFKKSNFLKILITLVNLLLLFLIFYLNQLPLEYFFFFLFLTILFFFTNYNIFYTLSIYLVFWIFVVFQMFYLLQELSLVVIEKTYKISHQIKKDIDWQIQKKEQYIVTIQKKSSNSKKIVFYLPLEIHFIEKQNLDFDFPLVFSIKKSEEKELPILSCFIMPKSYNLVFLDLRFRSILEKFKSQYLIEDYKLEKIDFYGNLIQKENSNVEVSSIFYSYYDRFHANMIQNGFYAIHYEDFYIIFWIREKKALGFPHDLFILEILKKNTKIVVN
ncbi:MAG: hypothetical protein ACK4UJ_07340 [Leptonema sp. (in: bacteria)]